jgi:hypothetical protein
LFIIFMALNFAFGGMIMNGQAIFTDQKFPLKFKVITALVLGILAYVGGFKSFNDSREARGVDVSIPIGAIFAALWTVAGIRAGIVSYDQLLNEADKWTAVVEVFKQSIGLVMYCLAGIAVGKLAAAPGRSGGGALAPADPGGAPVPEAPPDPGVPAIEGGGGGMSPVKLIIGTVLLAVVLSGGIGVWYFFAGNTMPTKLKTVVETVFEKIVKPAPKTP